MEGESVCMSERHAHSERTYETRHALKQWRARECLACISGMPIDDIIAMRACISASVAALMPGGALPEAMSCCMLRSIVACAAAIACRSTCQ